MQNAAQGIDASTPYCMVAELGEVPRKRSTAKSPVAMRPEKYDN